MTGRAAIPPDELRALVAPGVRGDKQVKAYNMCNGKLSQAQVGKAVGIDQGNFSRTVGRWEELGIAFRIGPDDNLLHLYPLP